MKVALTGATGFIGSRVAQQLRARGDDVVCLVRTPEKATDLAALGCVLKKGDILDKPSMLAAFQGCDAVIHMAASYELGLTGDARERARRFNLDGTRNALEAAHEAGAKRIVYTSSLVVYGYARREPPIKEGDPVGTTHPTLYSETKAAAHTLAKELVSKGLPIIIVQPGGVIGPRDHSSLRFIFKAAARGLPMPVGDAVYGMIDVDECARGHVLALDKGVIGHCYHFAAEMLSLQQLGARIREVTGAPARTLTLPTWALSINAAMTALVERVLPVPELFSSEVGKSAVHVHQNVDRTQSVTELGFEPRRLDTMIRTIIKDELLQLGKPLTAQLSA